VMMKCMRLKKIPPMSGFLVCQKKSKKRKTPSFHRIEDKEERSPFLQLYKNTCSKIQGVEKLISSIEASSASLMSTHIPTIVEAMRMVTKCGVYEKIALIYTATLTIVKSGIREILGLLETNEGILDWLEREHAVRNLP
jgi:hypothetical protein